MSSTSDDELEILLIYISLFKSKERFSVRILKSGAHSFLKLYFLHHNCLVTLVNSVSMIAPMSLTYVQRCHGFSFLQSEEVTKLAFLSIQVIVVHSYMISISNIYIMDGDSNRIYQTVQNATIHQIYMGWSKML